MFSRKMIFAVLTLSCCLLLALPALAAEWQGTDDLVDRKMQEVTGVSARPPLIDISKGNLGLFLFAAGGFAAGTLFGYQWRKIFSEKAGQKND